MGIDHSNPYIHSTTVLCDRLPCVLLCSTSVVVYILVKASLSFPVQMVVELEQQLQSNERENDMLKQQQTVKEAELTGAEETIRREQQVRECVHTYHYVQCNLPYYCSVFPSLVV